MNSRSGLVRCQTSFFHNSKAASSRSTARLSPRPAVPLQQPPRAPQRVAHVEQAAGRHLQLGQRPPLVGPTVDQRAAFQLPLQSDDLLLAEPRSPRRSLRQDSGLAALAPLTKQPLHRSLADPQHSSDLPVLVPALEASNGLQPDPLPRGPPCIGQPTVLRISHAQTATGAVVPLSGKRLRHHSIKFSNHSRNTHH